MLVEILYLPPSFDDPVRLIGEVFGDRADRRYFWVDGLSVDRPLLAPVGDGDILFVVGGVADLEAIYPDEVAALQETLESSDSLTLLARACVCMREDGLSASDARLSAIEMGLAMQEMDILSQS